MSDVRVGCSQKLVEVIIADLIFAFSEAKRRHQAVHVEILLANIKPDLVHDSLLLVFKLFELIFLVEEESLKDGVPKDIVPRYPVFLT